MRSVLTNNLTFNSFESISELNTWLKEHDKRKNADDASHEKGSIGWHGTQSFKEAVELMLGGDEEAYNESQKFKNIELDKVIKSIQTRNRVRHDVVGHSVDVSAYLCNLPECMLTVYKQQYNSKIINVVIDKSVSCCHKADEIIKSSSLLMQLVELLERAGYRCNTYVATSFCLDKYDHVSLVKIKDSKEQLNPLKNAFMLINPAMHRRIMFNWVEKCESKSCYDVTRCRYGHPIGDADRLADIVGKCLGKNFIVFSVQDNDFMNISVEKIIKNLSENYGIKIF